MHYMHAWRVKLRMNVYGRHNYRIPYICLAPQVTELSAEAIKTQHKINVTLESLFSHRDLTSILKGEYDYFRGKNMNSFSRNL